VTKYVKSKINRKFYKLILKTSRKTLIFTKLLLKRQSKNLRGQVKIKVKFTCQMKFSVRIYKILKIKLAKFKRISLKRTNQLIF
jgi:hypothetical protein